MTRAVTVRRATAEDWPAIRDVRLRALRDAPTAFSTTYDQAVERTSSDWQAWVTGEGWSGEVVTFVAESVTRRGGAPSAAPVFDGMATGAVFESEPSVAHLYGMWVAPSLRGTGLARELVGAVVAWARDRAVDEVRLCVTEGNSRAEALYANFGFARTDDDPAPLRNGTSLVMFDMRLLLEREPRS
jgi:ribosomal protein S18 acetylase RimI-like enzyme